MSTVVKMLPSLQWRLALLFIAVHLTVKSDSARQVSTRYAGPYKIKVSDVYRCNQSEPQPIDLFVHCNERNKTHNECHRIYGNATIRRDFTSNKAIPATIIVYQWRDREWKRDSIVMKFPDGFQSFRNLMPDTYRSIFKDQPRPKQGIYNVNITTDFNIKAFPVFPYGRWKGNMQMFEERQGVSPVMCIGFLINVVPK